jgi:hypothetical protein
MDSKQHIEIALRCGKVAWHALDMQRSSDAFVLKLQFSALISEVKALNVALDAAAAQGESPVKSHNRPSPQ